MDAVFIDFETTGGSAKRNQPIEFAAVPILKNVIRKDLMLHFYMRHKKWIIDDEVLEETVAKIKNRRAGIPILPYNLLSKEFRQWLLNIFPNIYTTPINIGGQNIGGFDMQFLFEHDPSLKSSNIFRWNYIDLGNMYLEADDPYVPSLNKCREKALAEGAPLSVANTHNADDDALLCAELFIWNMENHIIYAEKKPNTDTLKIDYRIGRTA